MSDFTDSQLERISRQLAGELDRWMRTHTLEPHYTVETVAELLQVKRRTVWNYLLKYEQSAGREGLGPFIKLSHKVVRIPASAVQRLLKAKTVDAAELATCGNGGAR